MQDKRLLICDDEPAFGRFVKNVAEDLGYEVRVTTDGHAFIEAYDSFKPTTIVLDMIMPGMDGNEIVLWLAKQKCTARLIIITGYTPDYADARQDAGGVQRTPAGDDIAQAGRSQRAASRLGIARILVGWFAKKPRRGSWRVGGWHGRIQTPRFARSSSRSVPASLSAPLPGTRRGPRRSR